MRSGKNIRLSETLGERYVVAARSLAAAVLFLAFPLLSFSQNIVFPDRQVSLAQAMDEIERQTGYTFAYNEGTVDMRRTVTFRSGRIQLRKVMDRLTEGSGLEYEIIGSQIILFPQSGEAISEEEASLSREDSGKVEILEESVVIGYGSVKRKDISTSVSIVPVDDADTRPTVSVASLLYGKASGVQVLQPSGMPGTPLSVRVRGATSVNASNEPLYVVDGIPTDDISNLSPNDIASVQILKDASSAAIYGARAANGVVIINTLSGKSGGPSLKFKAYAGVSMLGKTIEALDTEQYKELMNELSEITSTVPNIPETETRYTDWNDVLFGTGLNQNYQLSFSNGNDRLRYYASITHTGEDGIIRKANFRRSGFRANLDSEIFPWISVNLGFSYTHNYESSVYDSRSSLRSGSILAAVNTPPFMQIWDSEYPDRYDEDAYGARILNPMAANAADMLGYSDRITGAASLIFSFLKNFKLKSTFSVDLANLRHDYYLDPVSTSDGRAVNGMVSESNSRNFEWLFENVISFDKTLWGVHSFSALAGSAVQRASWNGNNISGYDLAGGYGEIHSISAANQFDENAIWSAATAWSIASFFSRITYGYDNRYLLTVNFRADGSSKFSDGGRWGFFPSVSAAWRISSEKWMSAASDLMNDLKLRVGWGMTGNQSGIGNYSYLTHYRTAHVSPDEDQSYPGLGLYPYILGNPDLTWEKISQFNIGADISLFKSRLVFCIDAYHKRTTDMLVNIVLPDNINYPGGTTSNGGEMVNNGIEFSVSSINFDRKFRWTTDLNVSFNDNKIIKLPFGQEYYTCESYFMREPMVILREGLPLGSFFGYVSEGVDPATGDIVYRDISGNGSIGPEDRTVIGCAQPDFTFGMTNNFSYKGFSLSILLQGSVGNEIFNASRIETEGMIDFRNQSTAVLRRWRKPGDITDIPRAGNVDNIRNSSRFIEDGSYLRVKNLTLSYSFPEKMLGKILSRLEIYVTAQNILTFTGYSGYDPEVNAYGASSIAQGIDYGTYPQSQAVVFGVNLDF